MFDPADLQRIRAARDAWADGGDAGGREREERRDRFATVSDHEVDALYGPWDLGDRDYLADSGFPGEPPFTRGAYPTMYRGRVWTMRQFAGFGTAEATNERFHYLIDEGQTGLSVAFDMPSLMGIDSDDALALGEVGKEGVAVDTLRDMEVLFEGIDLAAVSTSFTINPSAPVIYAMYLALADDQGVPRTALRGTLQNDMMKEFIAQKEWVVPPGPSLDLVTDVVEFSTAQTPKFHPISISGYHIREAGSTAVQELAFTIADGLAYVEDAIDRGLDVDDFAPRLSFFFNAHNSLFEEVAKYRVARRLWSRVLAERYGAADPDARRLKFHAQTAGVSLTAQQPLNNVVRVALQALAAVLGGTQSLHTNSYDEAHALPSEEAVRVALRTQQIIAEESGAADTVDPLCGSYFVETLTDEIEAEAAEYLDRIRDMGDGSMRAGVLAGIDAGYFQREIREAAYDYQRRVEAGDEVVVGVTDYTTADEASVDLHHVDAEAARARQLDRLTAVKAARDEGEVEAALAAVRDAIRAGENTLPAIVTAVKAYATMGEVMGVFEAEHGTYRGRLGVA